MTREEAARRYLEASRAASVHEPGHHGRVAHEETMNRLERRHPHARVHAIVGERQDFDQPLNRNDREHQLQLRRESGLTNAQISARRRELRSTSYGFPAPSEIYGAANPSGSQGSRSRRRNYGRAGGGAFSQRTAKQVASSAPAGAREVGSIARELFVAGLAISLLYLLLESEGGKGFPVLDITIKGITGALSRLASPTNNLFQSTATAGKTASAGTALTGTAASGVRVKVPIGALGRRVEAHSTITGQLH